MQESIFLRHYTKSFHLKVHFEPKVWDEYSVVFDNWELDYNVLGAGTQYIVRMDSYQFAFEEAGYDYEVNGFPLPPTWTQHPTFSDDPVNLYYLYSRTIRELYYNHPVSQWRYDIHEVYRRDVQYLISGSPAPGGTWQFVETIGALDKYVRPFVDAGTVGWTTYQSNPIGDDIVFTQIIGTATTEPFYGCIFLNDVLEFFADTMNLDYTSDFFEDTPNPMQKLTMSETMIQQLSNVKAKPEWATVGMMNLKQLLEWIRDTFNVFWYIDSNGDLRLEHRRYFDYGLSYPYTHIIELNLVTSYPTDIKHMNRYEWDKPELYRYEKLDIPYSQLPDWTEGKIEYPANSILGNNTLTKNVQWATDLVALVDRAAELPKDGWVLLDTYLKDLGGGITMRYVRNYTGRVTNNTIQNGRFSTGTLLWDWFTFGRILRNGQINGTDFTFDTIKRLKKQVELSFGECCQDLDYNGLYKTELGDGWIESAEYVAKTGVLKVNLIYE